VSTDFLFKPDQGFVNREPNVKGCGPEMTHLRSNLGCSGFSMQFISSGTIALGTQSPTDVCEAIHASPILWVYGKSFSHPVRRVGLGAIRAFGTICRVGR
jgi:hypothetical protein